MEMSAIYPQLFARVVYDIFMYLDKNMPTGWLNTYVEGYVLVMPSVEVALIEAEMEAKRVNFDDSDPGWQDMAEQLPKRMDTTTKRLINSKRKL